MIKNMGTVDKTIRILIAVVIFLLYFFNLIEGTLAYILMALAVIFIITSFVGFCPLYKPLGISTCKK